MKYENHTGIPKIKSKVNIVKRFDICPVTSYDINKIIKYFPKLKKPSGERTLHIPKENEFPNVYLSHCIYMAFDSGSFSDTLKLTDAKSVFKKGDSGSKSDYRLVSTDPLMLKVFEKAILNQLFDYLEKIFSSLLCGFRKRHGTQQALFSLLNKWKRQLDDRI